MYALWKKKTINLTKALSGHQVNELLHDVKGYRGVHMRDNLPKNIKAGQSIVINLDNSSGNGTHWTALYRDKEKLNYFDSFGMAPPQELVDLFPRVKIVHNTHQFQPMSNTNCGAYSVYFIREMSSGTSVFDTLFKLF